MVIIQWPHNLEATSCNKLFLQLFTMGSEGIRKCRACLITGDDMFHLQEIYSSNDNKVRNLFQLLEVCASVQVVLNDNFPQFICKLCFKKANDSYQFRLQCERSELQLQAEIKAHNEIAIKLHSIPILVEAHNGTTTRVTKNFPLLLNNLDKCESTENPQINLKADGNLPKTNSQKQISQKQHKPLIPIKQHTCDQCGKEFKYRASMTKHKRKHGITFRSCTYCNESLASATLLARHMEQMHAHLKNIKCSQCGKAFFKQANLRLHMNVHSGIKRHMCEVCGVSFALAGNLAAHRRLHTGSKPYTCNQCGRGFAQQAALRSHEAGHSDKKDHVCAECGAAFSRAGALRNHCKRHLPVRPFACSLCNKAFTFSSERKRHMTIHTGEKNHECNICGSRFNRSTNLAVHRRIHTGETPHICSVCGKHFSQPHCLRTHIASHTCTF